MTQRNEYCRELAGLAVAAVPNTLAGALRQPTLADAEPLAELMLDAYRGTIDDGGETIDNARDEVASYMASVLNPPLLSCSWLVAQPGQLAAACLICLWSRRRAPLVAYVVTRASHKRQALGQLVLAQSLASLRQAGYAEARAVITAENLPSEQLFGRLGFTRIEEPA
jgi:L-amino acid N-acyltransferase YncA